MDTKSTLLVEDVAAIDKAPCWADNRLGTKRQDPDTGCSFNCFLCTNTLNEASSGERTFASLRRIGCEGVGMHVFKRAHSKCTQMTMDQYSNRMNDEFDLTYCASFPKVPRFLGIPSVEHPVQLHQLHIQAGRPGLVSWDTPRLASQPTKPQNQNSILYFPIQRRLDYPKHGRILSGHIRPWFRGLARVFAV